MMSKRSSRKAEYPPAGAMPASLRDAAQASDGTAGPAAAAGSGAGTLDEIGELQNRLTALQLEFEQSSLAWKAREDAILRQLADTSNQLRRLRRDFDVELERQKGELLEPLIAVLDDIDRAMEHRPAGADDPFVQGVEAIALRLRETLHGLGLSLIPAVGEKFDPACHEALMQVSVEDVPRGQVVQELQKGYRLGDRVLRPSKVAVSG
jgi:molecular chaperone GrpE